MKSSQSRMRTCFGCPLVKSWNWRIIQLSGQITNDCHQFGGALTGGVFNLHKWFCPDLWFEREVSMEEALSYSWHSAKCENATSGKNISSVFAQSCMDLDRCSCSHSALWSGTSLSKGRIHKQTCGQMRNKKQRAVMCNETSLSGSRLVSAFQIVGFWLKLNWVTYYVNEDSYFPVANVAGNSFRRLWVHWVWLQAALYLQAKWLAGRTWFRQSSASLSLRVFTRDFLQVGWEFLVVKISSMEKWRSTKRRRKLNPPLLFFFLEKWTF